MKGVSSYFFCGIGGSGMLPLALILRARGCEVAGSDRALDQGRTGQKFDFLRSRGIQLFPQDGSGVTRPDVIVVTSTAVEATVPDVQAAKSIGARLMTRAQLLAQLFNASPRNIAVAGTSGKSTTTGMIAWILSTAGQEPTVMNGAVMKNFITPSMPYASALVGTGDIFVSEVDESDGSIALYEPRIAVLNNISIDHKSLEELRSLFHDFLAKAKTTVINFDNQEAAALASKLPAAAVISYSLKSKQASLSASQIVPEPAGISFTVHELKSGSEHRVALQVPGVHNVSNALAALAAACAAGVVLEIAARALSTFKGIKRRFEIVGTVRNITVIDDFAHNPDKIAATLETLHAFPGRLLIMFQPHGFGPLRLMRAEFVDCFANGLSPADILVMPEPVYFGGTVDRSVASADIVSGVSEHGRNAFAFKDRPACGRMLIDAARPGDRIVVMGARDDTLSDFAADLLAGLSESRAAS